jgi:hypothetical protein
MEAITWEDLRQWRYGLAEYKRQMEQPVDPMDPYSGPAFDRWVAEQDEQERQYRATLNATQMLAYLVHLGELGDECPNCHRRYVEVTSFSYPDMVGDTYGETYECCGHTWSRSSALEYNDRGEAVDIR